MKVFKIIFSLIFLLLAIMWILFCLEVLFIPKWFPDWETNANFLFLSQIPFFRDEVYPMIFASYQGVPKKELGFEIVAYAGSIFLIYNSLIILISKVPLIGHFIKSLTAFVSFLSVLAIILGALLWAGVIG